MKKQVTGPAPRRAHRNMHTTTTRDGAHRPAVSPRTQPLEQAPAVTPCTLSSGWSLATGIDQVAGASSVEGNTQRTLPLSRPGDRAESAADRAADRILDPAMRARVADSNRLRPLAAWSAVRHPVLSALQGQLEQGRDAGRPLSPELREMFEPGLGFDVGQVRIHTDEHAAKTARRLNANAFTLGHHLVFAPGQYRPDTVTGRHLLAHELAHVVQQLGHGTAQPAVQRDAPVGTVETSEGVQEIEGEVISSSASQIRDRLQLGEAAINTQIDEWARENFNHVAASLETAAESFENWYAAHSSSSSSSFVYDVVSAGLGILGAAYPPAGVVAAVLGGVLSIANSAANARDEARRGSQSNAALLVEQAMINKARALRNSSANFGSRMKALGGAGEEAWNAVGVALTMGDSNMVPIAKEELYRGARMPALDRDFTEPALSAMILTYTHWERISSLESSTLFVSSRDIEWMILSDRQRRERARREARRQLELTDESLR